MESVPPHLATGQIGEQAALDGYARAGYRLVARNWRCRLGELDLVLARGDTLVFCEVKARRSSGLGGPFEAVTWKKQQKLRLLAEAFLSGLGPTGTVVRSVRFDVASVTVDEVGPPKVHLFESAF